MNLKNRFTIRLADILVSFSFPKEVKVPKELQEFLIVEEAEAEIQYNIKLIDEPLQLEDRYVAKYGGMRIYEQSNGYLRVYSELITEDGCQVASFISNDKKQNVLYYPAAKWEYYSKELHFLHLMGIEEILLKNNALVEKDGHAVLFSGPSCVGKSTQAFLWKEHLGANILNGDRCVIRKIDGKFYGCGSPWAGTSGIYRKEMAPIKGIFILKQAKENTIRRLKAEAFVKLYQQCIVNTWDSEFVQNLSDLIVELLQQIPVYELPCRPDKEAVELAYNTLFKGGI